MFKFVLNLILLEAGRYIHELLYQADVVIVPGLGAFVSTYHPAQPDLANRKISPPAKVFQFDDSRKDDDRLLQDWIAEQGDFTETEARQLIHDFVADVQHEVGAGREVEIAGLGMFYKDAEGRTRFRFSVENNFDAEAAGLLEIDFPAAGQEPVQPTVSVPVPETKETKKEEVHVEAPRPVPPVIKAPPAPPTPPEQHPVIKTRKSRRWIWIAAAFILIIASGIYSGFQHKDQITRLAGQWFSRPRHESIDSLRTQPVDTSLGETLSEQANLKKALDVKSVDTSGRFIPYGTRVMKYYVVAASFNTYDNALKLQNELKSKGFDSEIITQTHQWYRVTMGTFIDRQEALVELEKLKTITRNSALWLMHI